MKFSFVNLFFAPAAGSAFLVRHFHKKRRMKDLYVFIRR